MVDAMVDAVVDAVVDAMVDAMVDQSEMFSSRSALDPFRTAVSPVLGKTTWNQSLFVPKTGLRFYSITGDTMVDVMVDTMVDQPVRNAFVKKCS